MAKFPFKLDGTESEGDEPEVLKKEEDEPQESALFDDLDESEEVTEEVDDDATLFEPEPDGKDKIPKGWTQGTYNRFREVIGQRNELRTDKVATATTIQTLQAAVEAQKGIVGVIAEKYGKFDNPAAMVAADAAFMDAVEELGKTNPEVARFGVAIQHFLKTGKAPTMADGTTPAAPVLAATPAPETTPAEDPRITKILEGNAKRDIKALLGNLDVKPSFRDIIADHVLKQDGLDLADISETKVVQFAKDFIKDKGFTAADVLANVSDPEKGGKGKGKAKTGGKAGVGVTDASARGDDGKAKDTSPKPPKDLDEWNVNREARRDAFVRESTTD